MSTMVSTTGGFLRPICFFDTAVLSQINLPAIVGAGGTPEEPRRLHLCVYNSIQWEMAVSLIGQCLACIFPAFCDWLQHLIVVAPTLHYPTHKMYLQGKGSCSNFYVTLILLDKYTGEIWANPWCIILVFLKEFPGFPSFQILMLEPKYFNFSSQVCFHHPVVSPMRTHK